MTRDVTISVKGLQAVAGSSDKDTVEIINVGQLSEMNGKIYISYEEVVEGEGEVVHNLFKITGDCIELVRKGALTTNMIFRRNEKTISYYETPFGSLNLGIFATKVDIVRDGARVDASTEYGLEINGEHIANCTVEIAVRPLEEGVKL